MMGNSIEGGGITSNSNYFDWDRVDLDPKGPPLTLPNWNADVKKMKCSNVEMTMFKDIQFEVKPSPIRLRANHTKET